MLIIEGPDGSGKTTLAHQLSELLNWPINPRVVATDTTPMVNLKAWTEDNIGRGLHRTIYDRHRLISEPIYGSLRRATEPASGFDQLSWYSHLLKEFWKLHPIVICCLPPLEIARERAMRDESNHIFATQYDMVYRMYYYWLGQNFERVFWYDSSDDDLFDRLVDKIDEVLYVGRNLYNG